MDVGLCAASGPAPASPMGIGFSSSSSSSDDDDDDDVDDENSRGVRVGFFPWCERSPQIDGDLRGGGGSGGSRSCVEPWGSGDRGLGGQ